MDGFYRGMETTLLAIGFLLGAWALAFPSGAAGPWPAAEIAVRLPMIAVSAAR